MYAQGKAVNLRQQAKDLLYETLGLSEAYCSDIVDRIVDYMVSAATLEMSGMIPNATDPHED